MTKRLPPRDLETPGPGAPPFLLGVQSVLDRLPSGASYPFSLPFVAGLDLRLKSPVTFFVGENGSGKSTLLEAIAAMSGLPVSGGSRADRGAEHGPKLVSELARTLRPSFRRRPPDGFFLRAEFHAHFASLLDRRAHDPDFIGDPYFFYGGRSLHEQSHGEAFLSVIFGRLEGGLFLFDEPESALSPQRQLALLARMWGLVANGASQFVVATHSPILLTFPGAQIVTFDEPTLPEIRLEETSHFQITRGILQNPAAYWKHLRADPDKV